MPLIQFTNHKSQTNTIHKSQTTKSHGEASHWPVRFNQKKKSLTTWSVRGPLHMVHSDHSLRHHMASTQHIKVSNKINIQTKAKNFKVKRESQREQRKERERERNTNRSSPRLLGLRSRRQARAATWAGLGMRIWDPRVDRWSWIGGRGDERELNVDLL